MLDTYRAELAIRTRGIIPSHLRRKFEPEDVVQEVYRRVCAGEAQFTGRNEAEVHAYLIRTLRSVVDDLVRGFDRNKRRVSLERPLEPGPDDSTARPERWLAADHTSPSQKARRNEQLALLARCLGGLPEEQRQAVELRHLKGLSLKKTAEIMGRTKESVAGLVRRGLIEMRKRLGDRAE
jgi:RNA polymerase sigma-70 factor (ECF subfamily)